jgi:hypothetical protein
VGFRSWTPTHYPKIATSAVGGWVLAEYTIAEVITSFMDAFTPSIEHFRKSMEEFVKAAQPWLPVIAESNRAEMRRIHQQYRQRNISRRRRK